MTIAQQPATEPTGPGTPGEPAPAAPTPNQRIQQALAAKGHAETSWDDIGSVVLPNGVEAWQFKIGDPDDIGAPAIFKTYFPPNCRIEPHTHDCDYAEIILEGSQKVSGQWFHPGDIRIAKGGQVYGPLIAGPEGVTVLVLFSDGRWPARPLGGKHDGGTLNVDVLTSRFA